MAAELGSYKQAHTSPPPLTLGNSRVVEGSSPSQGGSRRGKFHIVPKYKAEMHVTAGAPVLFVLSSLAGSSLILVVVHLSEVHLAWWGHDLCLCCGEKFSLQHSDPGQAGTEAPQPGTGGPGGQSTLLSSSTGKQLSSVSTYIKFLGIHITSDLTWSMNTAHLVKKAQQRLFFLRKLKRAGLSPQLLTNFYRATIESILCPQCSSVVWQLLHCTRPKGLSPGGENSTGDCGKGYIDIGSTLEDRNCNPIFESVSAWELGYPKAYSTSRADLKRGIKKAKQAYKLKVEEYFVYSDPRRMWQGIQAITDYKPSNSTQTVMNVSFLNELNDFYARFDKDNRRTTRT
ncbi:hypothetical protein L3Q82_008340 [Scortum barcoo]|uniref:Uncharacterized protein n=1 Tax=Scortum barcoo TaxID=214431 RepID=A0ACB8WKV3_9TELE|nr:hypothetical protein L3Q82_008340 [Scortum barcoo]